MRFPSGENMGKLSKALSKVIWTGSAPWMSVMKMLNGKAFVLWLELNRMCSPSGWKYGAQLAPPRVVICAVAAVHLGDEELHGGRLDEAFGKKLEVGVGFLALGRAAGAPHEVLAVGAEEGTAVVAEFAGDLLDVAAVDVAGVELEVATAGAGEDHLVALRADGLGV